MNRWAILLRSFLLFPLLLLGIFGTVLGQIENAVQFSYRLDPSQNWEVGQEITLYIDALIDPGYHMYSAKQVEGMEMMKATFDLDEETNGIELLGQLDDQGKIETKYDDVFENDISLYHDKVTYIQKLKITATTAKLAGFLRYQVCDISMCIPGSYDVVLSLKAVEKKEEPKPAPPPPPKQEEPKQIAQQQAKKEVKQATNSSPNKVELPTSSESISPIPQGNLSDPNARFINAVSWEQVWSQEGEPKKGDEFTISFTGKIEPGFHVYSSIPPQKPAGLPTTFNLNGESYGIELVGDLAETGEAIKKYDEIWETDVIQFEDEVTFIQKIKVTKDNPVIDAYLSYQVCDEGACVNEKVEAYETWGNKSPAHGTDAAGTSSSQHEEGTSLWVLMLQGFLLGFASVLTPCIFPMIPLTVTIFTKRYSTRAKGIRDAIFYGLSIIAIYTGLAVILTAIFGPAVLQNISNHPAFNIFFFLLLFVFALSFLGMFEIMLPASWSNAVSKGSDRSGLLGIFFMALALAIVSFSCTGPLVGTVLALAWKGSFLTPVMTMFAFSLAMALPFMLFAIFPGWLQSMPRSGGWLNVVKVVLGLLELALAFIYLSRADLVMHWGLLDREIFLGAWIVIFSILGFYLLGKIQLPHDSPVERLSVPRLLMAMGSFWFVLYLIPGLWGATLPMLGGFLPANTKGIGVILQDGMAVGPVGSGAASTNDICNYPDKISGHLSGDTPRGFCAFYDLEQGLEYAKQVNKPVFLDFTGHTCANCRYLEKTAWQDSEVRRYITEEYVLVSLYTDDRMDLPQVETTASGKKLRSVGDKWIQYQINTYNSNAQPYYVLLDHDNTNLTPPTGFNPPLDVQTYRDFFKNGLEEFRKRH